MKYSSKTLCKFCNSPTQEKFSELQDWLFGVEGNYAFHECTCCGSLTQFPYPKIEKIASFYDGYHTHEILPNIAFNRLKLRKKIKILLARLLLQLPSVNKIIYGVLPSIGRLNLFLDRRLKVSKVLDYGAGSCAQIYHLSALGVKYPLAVDFDPVVVNLAKQRGYNIISVADFQNYDDKFDVIILSHVIEHMYDPVREVSEILQRLQPDGKLIIEVPNCSSLMAKILANKWRGLEPPRHINIPSYDGLKNFAKILDCKVTRVNAIFVEQFIINNSNSVRFKFLLTSFTPLLQFICYFFPKWSSVISITIKKIDDEL